MTPDPAALFMDILEFDPHRRRINHLLKVTGYARAIAGREGMGADQLPALVAAAMLHDIGIKPSLEKYDSAAGPYQQREGPPVARSMLAKYDCPDALVERVCYLIAHHHDYDNIAGLDYRILVEADFLVNCDEKDMAKEQVAKVRQDIFRTAAGIRILDAMFEL